MLRHILLCLALCLPPLSVFSQENYRAGTLPQFNLNYKLGKDYKLNTKLESRQIFSEKEADKLASHNLRYERTDLAVILSKKISVDNTFGAGYMIRRGDGKFTHRLIQQLTNVRKMESLRMAHRFVADETFSAGEPVEFRLRYRLGLEKALNGRSIDPKEFYSKFTNEYLGIMSDGSPDLEIRGAFSIGYNATDANKVELGVEYRVNEFNESVRAQQFWITVAWFISL